ncbi:MAG: hypothetical protein K8Q97_01925 [Candidatus Andersenbacteria bacterium]|nr:hypothetical protein [Candidatus Andersenbacteria bacterium]
MFSFVYQNGPTIGFWLGILYSLWAWFSGLPILIRIILGCFPLIALIFQFKKIVPEIKTELLRISAQASVETKQENQIINREKKLINSVPTQKELKNIYQYAKNYAKAWASDGQLYDIVFYLKLGKRNVEKTAQIFLRSDLRGETLTTYLPQLGPGNIREEEILYNDEGAEIFSYAFWREAIIRCIERVVSDIEKSDIANVQVTSHPGELGLTFSFTKNNREWKKRFSLKNAQLFDDANNLIDQFRLK